MPLSFHGIVRGRDDGARVRVRERHEAGHGGRGNDAREATRRPPGAMPPGGPDDPGGRRPRVAADDDGWAAIRRARAPRERGADPGDRFVVERRCPGLSPDAVRAESVRIRRAMLRECGRGAPVRAPRGSATSRRRRGRGRGRAASARPPRRRRRRRATRPGGRSAGAPATVPRNAFRDAPTTRGTPGGARLIERAEEREVLVGCLAESETGVEKDSSARKFRRRSRGRGPRRDRRSLRVTSSGKRILRRWSRVCLGNG